MTKEWQLLKENCLKCEKCGLCKTRTNVVFGMGNPDSKILFIGEGPGQNEDLTGEPFVGRGGILLDKFLDAVDLSRKKNIYIANIVKCRPPQNRDPLPEEQDACIDYLREQVRIMKPGIIICLGRISAMKIIKPDFKITQEHGQIFRKGDTILSATFHPAALLRNPNQKGAAFEDFLKFRKIIDEEKLDIAKSY